MKYAGFIKRTAAFFVDCFITGFLTFILYRISSSFFDVGVFKIGHYSLFPYPIFILLMLLNYFIFEIFGQASLGKCLLGVKIVNKDSSNLTLKNKILRLLIVGVFIIIILLPNILSSGSTRSNENCGYIFSTYHNILFPMSVLCLIPYVCLLFSSKKQTLYDKLTKSFIIDNQKRSYTFAVMILLIGILLLLPFFMKELMSALMEGKYAC